MEPKSIYTRDSDQDGLTDAQELALGINPFSSDSDSDGLTDLEEVQRGLVPCQHQRKVMTWTYETISNLLSEMSRENYEDMVKAFLSMELNIKNKSLLDTLYQDFMAIDDLSLVSDDLRLRADGYQEQLQEELTDLLDNLYRTGEGASFIMEVIASNNILDTLTQYEVLDEDDYSSLTLETMQDIIQKDLSLTSQDYFGDVTYLALQKDLLYQKSHFLQQYVTTLMDKLPQGKDQSTLVLD